MVFGFLKPSTKYAAAEEPAGVPVADGSLRPAAHVEPAMRIKGYEACGTAYAVFTEAVKRFGSRRCVGTRKLINQSFDAKGFEKLTLGEYEWKTYDQFSSDVTCLASGLKAFAKLSKGSIVTIFAETKEEWMTALHASFTQGLTVATVYATLGAEGASFAVNQTKSTVVVADAKLLKHLIKVVETCKFLKYVVAIGEVPADLIEAARKAGLSVKTAVELINEGKAKPLPPTPPAEGDLAIIMYTSGTTGDPKGVMLTHANLMAGFASLANVVNTMGVQTSAHDSMAGYLPLAHIMEIVVENVMLTQGGSIGYGSPGTLTSTAPKIKDCVGDLVALSPTVFLAAPAVLDKVKMAVLTKVGNASFTKKLLFNVALNAGKKRRSQNAKRGFVGSPPFWNKLVFKNVQALLGGKVKVIGCGSAPLSPETQEFCEVLFNCPVLPGYGLTETCCAGTFVHPGDRRPRQVGGPMSAMRVKLVDWAEGNYFLKDKEDPNIGMARGEILLGGPSVCQGYYVAPGTVDTELAEKNATDFTVDSSGMRWMHTGDVGQTLPDGSLMIVDRKKDLVKLVQGEYVALSKVESVLKNCLYVDQVMAYGKGTKDHCAACIVPNFPMLQKWAAANGKGALTPAQLCQDADAVKEVSTGCLAECKKARLNKMETPGAWIMSSEAWTPENELLTAAQKMKRPVIVAHLKPQLDKVYA